MHRKYTDISLGSYTAVLNICKYILYVCTFGIYDIQFYTPKTPQTNHPRDTDETAR